MILVAHIFLEIPAPKNMADKCPKSRVSEDPEKDNKANGSKHCCNLNSSTFTLFINHCEGNCIGKSLF